MLNTNDYEETILLRKINKNVDLAKVWEKEPELNDTMEIAISSFHFFFIKDKKGNYVGAVLDMKRDLHWYIVKDKRKKGYLTKSLREAIIPFIFSNEEIKRDIQRITIEHRIGEINYKNSKNVAESVGFKSVNESETEFELSKDKFDWQHEDIEEKNGTITKARFHELRKRLIHSYQQLIKISDELLMAYDDDKGLREVAEKVGYFKFRIDDIEWKINKENQ